MNLSPVIIAIPMYFTLMAVELVYESVSKRRTYRLHDAVTNINTGVLQQLTNTFIAIFKIGIYTWIYENGALFELGQTAWTFVIAMIFWDLCYYWEHRMAHEISLFWGGHVVHHQSEDYNLSVALRQTSTGFIWGFPFFIPMALLGVHPIQFALAGGFNLLYQFWIHTEHINRLPRWFEAIFNTPSHHRVHHGRDPKYIDRNYGGILIIWDRLFGTFQIEEERPNYGITTPLKSWNPVYANFAHYVDLFQDVRRTRSLKDGLKVLFNRPGWLPQYLGGYRAPKAVNKNYQKFDRPTILGINIYVLVQFMVALLFNAYYLFEHKQLDPTTKIIYALWIIITTITFGLLFESRRKWVQALEILRLLAVPLGLYAMQKVGYPVPDWLIIVASIYVIASDLVFISLIRRQASPAISKDPAKSTT